MLEKHFQVKRHKLTDMCRKIYVLIYKLSNNLGKQSIRCCLLLALQKKNSFATMKNLFLREFLPDNRLSYRPQGQLYGI
jgi:hypothetical protein